MLGGAGSTPSTSRLGLVLVVDRIDTLAPGVDPEQWRRNALLAELVDATDSKSVPDTGVPVRLRGGARGNQLGSRMGVRGRHVYPPSMSFVGCCPAAPSGIHRVERPGHYPVR